LRSTTEHTERTEAWMFSMIYPEVCSLETSGLRLISDLLWLNSRSRRIGERWWRDTITAPAWCDVSRLIRRDQQQRYQIACPPGSRRMCGKARAPRAGRPGAETAG